MRGSVQVLPWRRVQGRGHVVLGVRASHHRRGIGRALLHPAIDEARRRSIHRLELTTWVHNEAPIAPCRSWGFEREGLRHASLITDGQPIDEIYMGLVL
ncbi:GNAT family N-acetyltransferase [Actinomadura oligospora]|uniref:GNAT family N-acetyltransferase n=1 Tax=Actinomadura oligospora TaxID=111804 RepID=UPI000A0335CC